MPLDGPADDGLDQWNEQHFAVWNGREISLSMNWKSGCQSSFSINAKRGLEDLAQRMDLSGRRRAGRRPRQVTGWAFHLT